MDIGAFLQIDNLEDLMKQNNIVIPRLRGIRVMENETPISDKKTEEHIQYRALYRCENQCADDFNLNPDGYEISERTDRLIKKYIVFDENNNRVNVNWNAVHGKVRKSFKYSFRMARRSICKQDERFNHYCGIKNVLCVHARIGGDNWSYFGGDEIARQPWFIEKIDDAADETYCDIYIRVECDKHNESVFKMLKPGIKESM